jgi:serine/threonine-protein kinase
MARIYRAEHEALQRQVALKVLTDGFARDREGRERFLREARISAALKHPNVVNIFDVGVQDGIPYLVMELLEGEDLDSVVQAQGALSESNIVDIMVPVVGALVAVHDAGVVHRDLKPGNIFLARGRNDEIEPRLLDFGISKVSGPEQLRLTHANQGLLIGTPLYMSPEAIRGQEMTVLSDQYSLGVVLYECATGVNPFCADTFAETVRRVTAGDFSPPTLHNPRLSKRLVRIIERAMSLEPQQRFKDFRELGRELLLLAGQRTRISWGLSFGELTPDRRSTSIGLMPAVAISAPPKPRQPSRLSWIGAAAFIFGMVTLISAIAVLWVRSTERLALTPVVVATPPAAPEAVDPTQTVSMSLRPAGADREPAAPSPVVEPSPGVDEGSEEEPSSERARGQARPTRPLARASRRAEAKGRPDWSVPVTGNRPLEDRPEPVPLGTNNAPILPLR